MLLERSREVVAREERDARERVLKLDAPKAEVRADARSTERAVVDRRIVQSMLLTCSCFLKSDKSVLFDCNNILIWCLGMLVRCSPVSRDHSSSIGHPSLIHH